MYLSNASIKFSEEDLRSVLAKSRHNNSPLGITGLLLFYNGAFLQVLEGEEIAVRRLYLKIMKDPRHTSVITLFDKEIEHRDFADWSMGFRNLSSAEWNQMAGYINVKDQHTLLQQLQAGSVEVITMIKTFFIVNAR